MKSPNLSAVATAAFRSLTADVTAFISSTADTRDLVALRWSPAGEGRGDMVPAATEGDGIAGWVEWTLAFEAISPIYRPSDNTEPRHVSSKFARLRLKNQCSWLISHFQPKRFVRGGSTSTAAADIAGGLHIAVLCKDHALQRITPYADTCHQRLVNLITAYIFSHPRET